MVRNQENEENAALDEGQVTEREKKREGENGKETHRTFSTLNCHFLRTFAFKSIRFFVSVEITFVEQRPAWRG